MPRALFVVTALLGFSGVALGAFGAHALRARLGSDLLAVYQTGVQYHLVHAAALVGVAAWVGRGAPSAASVGAWLLVAGVVVFSGSLYALALTGVRALGAVTPLGGVSFLAGWLTLAWAAWRAGGV